MRFRVPVRERYLTIGEVILIILLAIVPLFAMFPYRVNIFLSWEGAYRLSQGQLPFRDFGTPIGGMYWVIPGIFLKIFGTQMFSLIKAQVFINIISGLAFREILKQVNIQPGARFISVLLYCISFSFFNFWPWYNHSVIVYQFVSLAFLMKALNCGRGKQYVWLFLSALFAVFSFLTKQDAGAMTFLLGFVLLTVDSIYSRKWLTPIAFTSFFAAILFLVISPFLGHGFGYWFNYGQQPHSSRMSLFEIADEFFAGSQWIKFYIAIIIFILLLRFRHWKEFLSDQKEMLFLLLTLGILVEAAIFQVTSYTPPDNNIFYHSFAVAYILSSLSKQAVFNISNPKIVGIMSLAVLLWWSQVYWKYFQRLAERSLTTTQPVEKRGGENVVNKHTFIIPVKDTIDIPMSEWGFSKLKSFEKIYMPNATIAGIERVMSLNYRPSGKVPAVLNMTELTPLAAELPYELEKGSHYPLWYHLGVGMFNREAKMFEDKITKKEYDLVLFEYVPKLNNFYPFRVRDSLLKYYQKTDSFPAPRRGDTPGTIEVFTK